MQSGNQLPEGREEEGSDDSTKAGGGNLHRGRGATAWGREEEGGNDSTKAGGATSTGNGEPLPGAEKWGSKTEVTRQRPSGAISTLDGEPLPGAAKTEASNSDLPIYPDL